MHEAVALSSHFIFQITTSTKGKHPPKSAMETLSPSHLAESPQPRPSPHSESLETPFDTSLMHRREYDMIKLLEAVARFRLRNGIKPMRRNIIPDFLKEVKDFVPPGLSEKELISKLYNEMYRFRKKPCPGPDCPDSDRSLYELKLKAWGPPRTRRAKPNARSLVKHNRRVGVPAKKKQNDAMKKKMDKN